MRAWPQIGKCGLPVCSCVAHRPPLPALPPTPSHQPPTHPHQLMYIVGIDLAGVSVAACMQPAIPVFTAALAIATGAEAPSRRKLAGVGLAVGGALCMVVGGHVGAAGGPGGLFAGIGLGHAALLANTFSMARGRERDGRE